MISNDYGPYLFIIYLNKKKTLSSKPHNPNPTFILFFFLFIFMIFYDLFLYFIIFYLKWRLKKLNGKVIRTKFKKKKKTVIIDKAQMA